MMTQATSQQFEDIGAVKENVRFNEKAIDEIKQDIRGMREDINVLDGKISDLARNVDSKIQKLDDKISALAKDVDDKISALAKDVDGKIQGLDDKISTLSEQYQSLGWKGLLGIVTIVLANIILKFIPV